MNSRWLVRIAASLAVLVSCIAVQSVRAQGPRTISYQGVLTDANHKPISGQPAVKVEYFSTGTTPIWTETFVPTIGADGVFNLLLGSSSATGFPSTMNFSVPYTIKLTVNGYPFSTSTLASAPYAMNAATVGPNAIEATNYTNRVSGKLWPVPVDAGTGKIDPSVLPASGAGLSSINGVSPDATGMITISAGANTTITPDAPNHKLTIAASGSGGGVTSITLGSGLSGGGTGAVTIGLQPGAITASDIAPGGVMGKNLDQNVAGAGLVQNSTGNLDVNVDNTTLAVTGDVLGVKTGGIGSSQLAANAIDLASVKFDNAAPHTSNGAITFSTATGGLVNTGNFSNGGVITIGSGASSTSIASGASGAAKAVTLPNATGTMAVVLKGSGVLSAGAATIAIPGVTPTDFVMVSRGATLGPHPGNLIVVAGTGSVSVSSDNALDTGSINVIIVRQ